MRLPDWIAWKRRRESDLDEEIAAHLAMAARDRVADGADVRDAALAARKEFGNVTLTREATRLTWGALWLDRLTDLLRDAGYAARLLRRSPAYSLTVIAVLALGMTMNVIAFGIFKALTLTPLAGVPRSASLQYVGARTRAGAIVPVSVPDYRDIASGSRSFSALAASAIQQAVLGRGERGRLVMAELVSGNFFQTLGVSPQYGRTLLPSDDVAPGGHPVAVLSDALWRESFESDPAVIGSAIELNGVTLVVVGVTPPEFRGSIVGLSTQLFVPLMMHPQVAGIDWLEDRANRWIQVFGRLRPGVTADRARAEMAVVSARIGEEFPIERLTERATMVSVWRWPYGAQTFVIPIASLMGAMSALLLVVVCANVAGLVLVRGLSRRGEIAARCALGASRGRIVRLLWMESAVLALPGGAIGLALPLLLEPVIGAPMENVPLPLYFNAYPDRLVFAFAVALAAGCALLYGLVPAVKAARLDLAAAMKDNLAPSGETRNRLRTALVVMQVAMSLILLIGTALVLRTLDQARRADPGFEAADVGLLAMDLRGGGYDETRGLALFERLHDRIAADPAVEAASLALYLPLTLVEWESRDFVPEGYARRPDENLSALNNVVTSGYFETLKIPLLAGREFDRRDVSSSTAVVIVNETFARRFWGDPSRAIGTRVDDGGTWRTVVGVARDAKYARLDEEPRPYVYLPLPQMYRPGMTLQARVSSLTPETLDRLREHVRTIDPNLPILGTSALQNQMQFAVSIYETVARMLTLVGVIAMLLTALGIYGLVAYTVKQSAHDIGIRTAIGASRRDIAARFVLRGMRLGAAGVVLGVAAAAAATRLMSSMLFGVSAVDAASFSAAIVLVLSLALVASLIPAWRAARLDPLAALRHQ